MGKKFFALMLMMLFALSANAQTAPDPYWKWKSKLTEVVVCQQKSPGENWEKHAGPFRDSLCKHKEES